MNVAWTRRRGQELWAALGMSGEGGRIVRPTVPASFRTAGGFTLIELMIVIAIMAIVMTMSIPLLYKATHREALNKAVRDMVEVCSQARAMAILHGKMTELVFHPREGRCEVAGLAKPVSQPHDQQLEFQDSPPPEPNSGLSAQISDKLAIEMLDVNLIEYKDAEYTRVRFFPNGTCDEFTLILHSDRGEWIKIWLEITTGMVNVGAVNQ
jgi:prepilin-type N-terminal cleavage/methylation domain-containing protein